MFCCKNLKYFTIFQPQNISTVAETLEANIAKSHFLSSDSSIVRFRLPAELCQNT